MRWGFLFSNPKPPSMKVVIVPLGYARRTLMFNISSVCNQQIKEIKNMSRYDSSSHVYYRCQYHIVWTPKYRLKILNGNIGKELYKSIYVYSNMKNCRVVELNVQVDHVHLVVRLPPSLSISSYMGFVKGRTAIRLFNKFPYLRKKKLWGNHFWQRGYFVDSVGMNEEIIRRYVRHQDRVGKEEEARQMLLGLEN